MKLNINGKRHSVKSLSELTFKEFNKVLVKAKVGGLDEYLSVFLDIDKNELLGSKIKSYTLDSIHKFIFDIDVTAHIKTIPKAIMWKEKAYMVADLSLDTFGKAYYYDLYFQRYKAQQLNEYQLGLYALAVALTDSLDEKIEITYAQMEEEKWTKFLPTSFFLLKKYRKPKRFSIMLLIRYTWGLRLIRWRINSSKRKWKQWVKT